MLLSVENTQIELILRLLPPSCEILNEKFNLPIIFSLGSISTPIKFFMFLPSDKESFLVTQSFVSVSKT